MKEAGHSRYILEDENERIRRTNRLRICVRRSGSIFPDREVAIHNDFNQKTATLRRLDACLIDNNFVFAGDGSELNDLTLAVICEDLSSFESTIIVLP